MKTIKMCLATIAALLCCVTVDAADFEVDGIYYAITSSDKLTVTVTYKGSKWNSYNEYTGVVTIPETVVYNNITYRVTSIGGSAFSGCTSLTSIIIPESVTIIENNAFEKCTGLTSLVIPDGVTSIENYAFCHCDNLSSIVIGKNVNSIGKYTFSSTIGESFTSLGLDRIINYSNVSFEGIYGYATLLVNVNECTNIDDFLFETTGEEIALVAYIGSKTELVLPSSFNGEDYIIGPYAFSKTNITNVTISNNVKTIKDKAFYGCDNLYAVVIENGVTSIGTEAFSSCSNLSSLTIGSNVSTIGSSAFAGCNEIESIYALNTKAITCDESIFATDAYNNAILYVPSDRVFAYEKATPWNKFQIEPMKKFTVTYKVNGEAYKTIEIEYAAEITLPENPTREGYTFMGWSEVPETMPANDITIYGSFAINKYLVTFKVGDEVIASDSLEYGASIVTPEAPEKEGYTFNGWGEVAETVPAGDVTYEGNYSVNSYKLTFIVDGEIVQESSVDYGTTITLPEEPTKEGYSFDGWNEIPETMPASDVTVSGTFTVNKYLVTFRINNEVIASDSLEYGASIVTPEAPEKEGYTFDGWANVPETVPACNLTIEGGYTANEYLLAFIIDGALYEMRKVRCDEKITALDMVEREGCTFVWENWIDKMPAKDYTVKGKYIPNKYAITYMVDGEILATDSIAYGTIIEALEEPAKEGYTFSGWSEVPETMPAEDIVISGSFTVDTYKVYYYVGEELVHTAEVAYGDIIPEYVYEPTVKGEAFVGWIGEAYETMPAHDITYKAEIKIADHIEVLSKDTSRLVIYDMTGHKITVNDVRELSKGIYIINGRKVLIK